MKRTRLHYRANVNSWGAGWRRAREGVWSFLVDQLSFIMPPVVPEGGGHHQPQGGDTHKTSAREGEQRLGIAVTTEAPTHTRTHTKMVYSMQ